jgi:hypothetical protein
MAGFACIEPLACIGRHGFLFAMAAFRAGKRRFGDEGPDHDGPSGRLARRLSDDKDGGRPAAVIHLQARMVYSQSAMDPLPKSPFARLCSKSCRRYLMPAMLATLVMYAPAAFAGDLNLLNISMRAKVSDQRVLGKVQPVSFEEEDVMATFRLPQAYQIASRLGLETRFLASVGILQGAGRTAVVASAIPALAIASQDGRFYADAGAGLAVMSQSRYGNQDFGGPLQFALTAGFGVPLYGHFGIGYRFLHYSDAALYSSSSIGADFHMLELLYRF